MGPNKLDEAISHARQAHGFHFDAVRDNLDATTLRLEVLRLELQGLVKGQQQAEKFVDLQLLGGDAPRLWIDLVTYVVMAPTARQYRLVRDRQDSSEILFESEDRAAMREKITAYIAGRIVARERHLPPDVMIGESRDSKSEQKYSSAALLLAWFSGVLLGIIGLFAFGVWFSGS